ncbi:MAG: hypothetical protein AMXMBFR53_41240 [Gemmatimonadota bacterium]
MDELILKVLSGNATDLELRQVERWRQEAPGNERAYRARKALWGALDAVSPDGAAPTPPPVGTIVAEAERRRRREGARARGRAALRSPWLAYGTAAAAVVALVALGLRGPRAPADDGALTPVASSSGPGSVTTMELSDGSLVRVAPATSVDFPVVRARREVVLQGRAFFAVAEGDVPFVVRTDRGVATVHGTRFEVMADDAGLRLVVVEGRVRLETEGGSADVDAGQVAWAEGAGAPRVVERADVWSLLDWDDGLLIYQATPLADVAGEVGRHFGRAVEVDAALSDRRVTAWFEDETLDEVVAAVCLVVGARCAVGDSLVTMTGR